MKNRFSFWHALRRRNLVSTVFNLGCFAWLYYVKPYLGRYSLFLIKLLRLAFPVAAACVAGLSWYLRDSASAWFRSASVFSVMDWSIPQRYISLNFLIALFALSWLFLRLRKVLSIPVDDLVKILGLEVPSPPSTTLLEITSSGATIHWKPPEHRSSVAKYVVRINGFIAGEFSSQENAVTISDLPAGRCYTIRIVAVNSSNFHAFSDPIRIKLAGESTFTIDDKTSSATKRKRADADAPNGATSTSLSKHPAPTVVACKAFPDLLASAVAPAMAREPSGSHSQPKRGSTSSRRGPPAVSAANHPSSHDRERESDVLQALNNKLEDIRAQIREQEKQDEEEEAEFQTSQAALVEQRNSLKKQLKERDDESKDLNKIVKGLEHANSVAQNKKLQQEKVLNDKIRAREKMQEDIARWDKEVPEIEAEILALEKQRTEIIQANEEQVLAIKAEQTPDLEALAAIEERIQECGREVKELDDEKKRLEDEENADSAEANERSQAMAAEEREWIERISQHQTQLNNAMTAYYQTQAHFAQAQQRMEMLNARRNSQANGYSQGYNPDPPSASVDMSNQAHHSSGMRVNFDLPESRANPMSSPYARTLPSSNTSYRTSSPTTMFGMTVNLPSRPPNLPGSDLRANVETLTGGAMTSPSAGDLLPSGLLGDDVEELGRTPQSRNFPPQRRELEMGSRPTSIVSGGQIASAFGRGAEGSAGEPGYLPGLGTIPGLGGETINPQQRSRSGSFASPSPSAVSSPHGSLANLHHQRSSDTPFDNSDRRSIKSTSESAKILPPSRRFDFFGRQRGKTTTDGPALGSLKAGQSQSMPRDTNDAAQAFANSRNQSKGAGGLFGQMSSAVLGRKATVPPGEAFEQSDLANLGRGGSVSSFQSASNPWSRSFAGRRTSLSRPGSTYSTENALPKPAVDVPRFGWGVSRESLHHPGSIHAGSAATKPWSPFSSRRPSVQQDGQSASIWEIGDAEVDHDEDQEDANSPPPAPIGTKPKKYKELGDLSKQLNPNARDFTSMFGFGRKGDKTEKAPSKSKKKDKAKAQVADDMASSMTDDSSPPDSRKSRDTLLSSNAESFEDEETADEQNASHPATPHESAPQATPGGRDSFRRMLSGKGSSSKFSLPTLKDKSGLFSKKANLTEEHEDDSGSYSVATPDKRSSGFSLSFKKRAKKDNDTPSISETSISETSMASENADDDMKEQEADLNTP